MRIVEQWMTCAFPGSRSGGLPGVDRLRTFRLLLAGALIWNLMQRIPDLEAFYGVGAFPSEGLSRILWPEESTWRWPSAWLAMPAFRTGILGLQILMALGLAWGWRARLFAALSLLMMMALQASNEAILFGADDLLRVLLFWACWLPIDRRGPAFTRGGEVSLVAFRGQATLLYVASAFHKMDPAWFVDGSALGRALGNHLVSRPWTAALDPAWSGFRVLSVGVACAELLLPLLLWVPWRRMRAIALGGLVLLHLGIIAFFRLDLFPPLCLALLAAVWAGVDAPPRFPRSKGEWVPALALLWAVAINLANLLPGSGLGALASASRYVGLHQHWGLFAPHPTESFGIHRIEVQGRLLDPWPEGGVHGGEDGHAPQWRSPFWLSESMLLYHRPDPRLWAELGRLACARPGVSGRVRWQLLQFSTWPRAGEPLPVRTLWEGDCPGAGQP